MIEASNNPSYTGPRPDLLAMLEGEYHRVLDIGCSDGTFGQSLKLRNPLAHVTGIEQDAKLAATARSRLDRVIESDLERDTWSTALRGERFDLVTAGDIVEHLRDPWMALKQASELMEPGASLLISIPNVAHISTFAALLGKRWPYRDRGIHDRTHLRFFALANLDGLVESAGCKIERIERNFRVFEAPHKSRSYVHAFDLPLIRDFFTFQYLVLARRTG